MHKIQFVAVIMGILISMTGCHKKDAGKTVTDSGMGDACVAPVSDSTNADLCACVSEFVCPREEEIVICDNEDGCDGCEIGEYRRDGLCVSHQEPGDGGSGIDKFICDKPEGCNCGTRNALCPYGNFCIIEREDPDWSGAISFKCVKPDLRSDDSIFDELFNEQYFSLEDVKHRRNYYLYNKDGLEFEKTFVLCSEPCCDCGGKPLQKDYFCIEQHVVFDSADQTNGSWDYSEYGVCPKYYKSHDKDKAHQWGKCDIAEDIAEQVCFNPKGCACGKNLIAMGDVCKDGRSHCSATNSRPGCMCGNKPLEANYGCYHDSPICQAETCVCRGNEIDLGDICADDKIICGANSRTPGCICGDKPLREGYRCFNKEQLCDCKSDDCHCSCGQTQIDRNVVCRDDDTPLIKIPFKHEESVAEGFRLGEILYCGDQAVPLRAKRDIFMNGTLLDINDPDDQKILCECGTGQSAPGDGYGCGFEAGTVGVGSEWTSVSELAGWQCQRFEGCSCGNETCMPGDMCQISPDGMTCLEFNTFKGECGESVLPPALIHNERYQCYDPYKPVAATGWYCSKAEGCVCGESKCGYLQRCLSQGKCSEDKLPDSAVDYLESAVIDASKDLD